jgi:hypothetical protein
MSETKSAKSYVVDRSALPALYPTHMHPGAFWEQLGRTMASFGFLEEVLGKAIFAFTATRNYSKNEIENAYETWMSKLEIALSGDLWKLADNYGKALKENQRSSVENVDDLVQNFKDAAKVRNILCHASWRVPDDEGKSLPFFVSRKNEVCETKFDIELLRKVQDHVNELACDVVDSVTQMGYQFPGGIGPGERIWPSHQ